MSNNNDEYKKLVTEETAKIRENSVQKERG